MVQATINLGEDINQIVNVTKAAMGLKTKSEALEFIVSEYAINVMNPRLRPECVKKLEEKRNEPYEEEDSLKAQYGL